MSVMPNDGDSKMDANQYEIKKISKRVSSSPPLTILIVSDFFFPRLGGVELHQYSLAQRLMSLGYRVIVLTGTFDGQEPAQEEEEEERCEKRVVLPTRRQGIRWMSNGLKVYYLPVMSIHSQASMPFLFGLFPLFRQIVLRERVDLVHGHQTTSALAHECLLHATTMGIGTVYTDHSLFGFSDAPSVHLNKLMTFTLTGVNHCICVSHCMRENLCLRAQLDPAHTSVIPNAFDSAQFEPSPPLPSSSRARSKVKADGKKKKKVTIVIMARLVYRKGVDIVAQVIPVICKRFPHVHFIVGGDGNKRLLIEEMRERHQLQRRVELLGAVPHSHVRSVLVRGDYFLNCSLTEAFCIAILEAVSCGLFAVSTRVGGVPEVLPSDMIAFAECNAAAVIETLSRVLEEEPHADMDRWAQHRRVKGMYNWQDVSRRTARVYESVARAPRQDLLGRVKECKERGGWLAGFLFVCVLVVDVLLLRWLEWGWPREDIEPAVLPPFQLSGRHTNEEAQQQQQQQPEPIHPHQH